MRTENGLIKSDFGMASAILGVVSIIAILGANYAESFRGAGSSSLLRWLDSWGLITPGAPHAEVYVSNPSLFSFTDETAILSLQAYGIYLAGAAMLLAIWADRRREASLAPAIGFICGGLALVHFNYAVGFVSMVAGMTVVTAIRMTFGRRGNYHPLDEL